MLLFNPEKNVMNHLGTFSCLIKYPMKNYISPIPNIIHKAPEYITPFHSIQPLLDVNLAKERPPLF